MKILVLSDIHANLAALEAVLAAAGPVNAIWNLGDTVGYGPDPSACLHLITEVGANPMLVGNHDLAAIGAINLDNFNPVARAAAEWTRRQLTPDEQVFLGSLPGKAVASGMTLAHGSPRDPVWEYVVDSATAAANFDAFAGQICLIGHSHVALSATPAGDGGDVILRRLVPDQALALDERRWLINPGSVGQPRDGDPRAAFAIFDSEALTVTGRRIAYDIPLTQRRMRTAGLPDPLVARLAQGW